MKWPGNSAACTIITAEALEEKRRWVRDSMPLFAAYGTPQAIYNYLQGVFERNHAWKKHGSTAASRTISGSPSRRRMERTEKGMDADGDRQHQERAQRTGQHGRWQACMQDDSVSGQGGILARIVYPMCGTLDCAARRHISKEAEPCYPVTRLTFAVCVPT